MLRALKRTQARLNPLQQLLAKPDQTTGSAWMTAYPSPIFLPGRSAFYAISSDLDPNLQRAVMGPPVMFLFTSSRLIPCTSLRVQNRWS